MSKTDCRQQSNSHQSKCRQNLKMKVTLEVEKSRKKTANAKDFLSQASRGCSKSTKLKKKRLQSVIERHNRHWTTLTQNEKWLCIKRLFKVYKTKKEREPFCNSTCVLSKPPAPPTWTEMTTNRQLKMKTVDDFGYINLPRGSKERSKNNKEKLWGQNDV